MSIPQLIGWLTDLQLEAQILRDQKETYLICTEFVAEGDELKAKLRRIRP